MKPRGINSALKSILFPFRKCIKTHVGIWNGESGCISDYILLLLKISRFFLNFLNNFPRNIARLRILKNDFPRSGRERKRFETKTRNRKETRNLDQFLGSFETKTRVSTAMSTVTLIGLQMGSNQFYIKINVLSPISNLLMLPQTFSLYKTLKILTPSRVQRAINALGSIFQVLFTILTCIYTPQI